MSMPQTAGPAVLIHRLAQALNAGDLTDAMKLFGDAPYVHVVPAPPGQKGDFSGRDEISAWFEELIAANFRIEVEIVSVEGEVVTTRTTTRHDITRTLGVAPLVGTEEYVISDGAISGFTYRFSDDDLERIQQAIQENPEPTP